MLANCDAKNGTFDTGDLLIFITMYSIFITIVTYDLSLSELIFSSYVDVYIVFIYTFGIKFQNIMTDLKVERWVYL